MAKKIYDVTLYYYKKVEVEAQSEQEAIEKAHMGYGDSTGLYGCDGMDEAELIQVGDDVDSTSMTDEELADTEFAA